ncbi:MAG: D-glycero-beta-D-manno-heptose-7-phosphate kinase [Neisseriaceae bacterium]
MKPTPIPFQVLKKILKAFSQIKILVVGDAMLDQYWFGDTYRISPEAPVPVAKVEATESRVGGAANVARNIASLKGEVCLLSVTGTDQNSNDLESILARDGVQTHLIKDSSINTTVKLRVLARNQQLLRIDFESSPSESAILRLKDHFRQIVQRYNLVVFSDYDKGALKHVAELLQIAKNKGLPVLVDPKGEDYSKYSGATLITPNRLELQTVIGTWENEATLTAKAQKLRKILKLKSLLLTRSEEGLSLYQAGRVVHEKTVPREVFDVSGAGDTIIAVAALALGIGLEETLLMRLANAAAGVVVGKLGTATCSQNELIEVLCHA